MKKIIFLSVIILGIAIIILAIFQARHNSVLRSTGIKTIATIVDERVEIRENKRRNGFQKSEEKTVFPIYEFETMDNQVHRVDGTVGGFRVTMGKICTIYYNPKKPEQDFLIEEDSGTGIIICYIVGGILIIIGIIMATLYRSNK